MGCNITTLKTKDKKHLLVRIWDSLVEPHGLICMVHGLGEHSGRYSYCHAAEYLSSNGYGVIAFDIRGHGKSFGKRGHIDSYETLLNDIEFIVDKGKSLFPNIPVFLIGHSMGGNLVLNYAIRREHKLQGIIALSPWIELKNPPSKFLIGASYVLNLICPSITVDNGIKKEELTHDKEIRFMSEKDSLTHNRISFRLFLSMYKSGRWILENFSNLRIPLLLMHGDMDMVTSYEASKRLAYSLGSLCTFVTFKGFYHELLNEEGRKDVLNEIKKWLNNFQL